MNRRIALVFGLLVAGLAIVPMASAATQTQAFCDWTSDTTRVELRENPLSDGSDGNDVFRACFSETRLEQISHTPAGNCHSPGIGSGTWNDCVDAYRVWLPSNQKLCFYRDATYSGFMDLIKGPQAGTWFNLPTRDVLSSFRFVPSTTPC